MGTTWKWVDSALVWSEEDILARLDYCRPPCTHDPVLTGMVKSWCKHCDANMVLRDGAYTVE